MREIHQINVIIKWTIVPENGKEQAIIAEREHSVRFKTKKGARELFKKLIMLVEPYLFS